LGSVSPTAARWTVDGVLSAAVVGYRIWAAYV
jgi:hypothetical protein